MYTGCVESPLSNSNHKNIKIAPNQSFIEVHETMFATGTEIGTDVGEGIVESVTNSIVNSIVNSRAKAVVTKGIDYTLLVVLLVFQYIRCEPPTFEEIKSIVENSNGTHTDATSVADLYSCSNTEGIISGLKTKSIMSTGIIVAAILAITYGVVSSIFVWIHAIFKFNKKVGDGSIVETMYEWTDTMIIIDSILEIPISLVFAPIMTLFLWTIYVGFLIGLYFTAQDYTSKDGIDSNAANVFYTSSFMLALSLLKLTGEISQYWVIYKASSAPPQNAKEKMQKLKSKRELKKNKKSKKSKRRVGVEDSNSVPGDITLSSQVNGRNLTVLGNLQSFFRFSQKREGEDAKTQV